MNDSPIALGDFDFSYPDELVAQEPISPRGASRLLALFCRTGERKKRFLAT